MHLYAFSLGWLCFFGVWMISYVCVYGGSAGKGGTSENKSRQAAWDEDNLGAGCYQQDSSHTGIIIFPLFTHPVSFIDAYNLKISSLCAISTSLFAWRYTEQLVLGRSQVLLKRGNPISWITTLKIIKSTFEKKHNTLAETVGAKSVAANTEECRGVVKRVS